MGDRLHQWWDELGAIRWGRDLGPRVEIEAGIFPRSWAFGLHVDGDEFQLSLGPASLWVHW